MDTVVKLRFLLTRSRCAVNLWSGSSILRELRLGCVFLLSSAKLGLNLLRWDRKSLFLTGFGGNRLWKIWNRGVKNKMTWLIKNILVWHEPIDPLRYGNSRKGDSMRCRAWLWVASAALALVATRKLIAGEKLRTRIMYLGKSNYRNSRRAAHTAPRPWPQVRGGNVSGNRPYVSGKVAQRDSWCPCKIRQEVPLKIELWLWRMFQATLAQTMRVEPIIHPFCLPPKISNK